MSDGRIPLSGGSGASGGATPGPGQSGGDIPVGLPIGADLEPGGKPPDDDGVLDFAADAATGAAGFVADKATDAASDAAKWTGGKLRRLVGLLLRGLVVVFLPIPVKGLAKQQLSYTSPPRGESGKRDKRGERGGALRFVPQQPLVATMHVIWIGWLVGAGTLYNHLVDDQNLHLSDSVINGLEWVWIGAICLTVLMMGLDFGRVAFGFLIAVTVVAVLSVLLYEQVGEVELVKQVAESLKKIDVELGWGVPIIVSAVLGVSMMISSTWQQLNDQWEVAHQGNFLEHENFAAKDLTIQKGAKTFIHSWPCLVKRFLLFGYGEIEVRDSRGQTMIAEIKGVIGAYFVSNELKKRFQTTDVELAIVEEEEEEAI
jgi:hypothetical protein